MKFAPTLRWIGWRHERGGARYFGAAKTQAQMAWAALGLNLLKAMRKLQSGGL